jgi:hypothetical protein
MAKDTGNFLHVISEVPCTDPDCEIHNPEVGLAEEVVSHTDAAFYYAGAVEVMEMFLHAEIDCPTDADDEVRLTACLKAIRTRLLEAM